ncbi:MAG TPA: hypothetical protein VF507_10875 [Pyrinomonadaceae bacterium]|jgi:cobalamin biosynthesis Mg chelatase CobN
MKAFFLSRTLRACVLALGLTLAPAGLFVAGAQNNSGGDSGSQTKSSQTTTTTSTTASQPAQGGNTQVRQVESGGYPVWLWIVALAIVAILFVVAISAMRGRSNRGA